MIKVFDKKLFGERLTEAMSECDDTPQELASFLKLSQPTVSRYMSGKMAPKHIVVQAIASRYNVNPVWLLGARDADKYLKKQQIIEIPVVGTIAAGSPLLAQENVEYHEYVLESENIDFCLIVKGDSMINARIYDGDVVFIRKQDDVENGEIAVVLIDEEATLKRVYKVNGTVILHAENPMYQDMVFSAKDYKQIKILGKAVAFKSFI